MTTSNQIKLNIELIEQYGCVNVTGSTGEDSTQIMINNGYELIKCGGPCVGEYYTLIESDSPNTDADIDAANRDWENVASKWEEEQAEIDHQQAIYEGQS